MKMGSEHELKEIDIESCAFYYFDDIILMILFLIFGE